MIYIFPNIKDIFSSARLSAELIVWDFCPSVCPSIRVAVISESNRLLSNLLVAPPWAICSFFFFFHF